MKNRDGTKVLKNCETKIGPEHIPNPIEYYYQYKIFILSRNRKAVAPGQNLVPLFV